MFLESLGLRVEGLGEVWTISILRFRAWVLGSHLVSVLLFGIPAKRVLRDERRGHRMWRCKWEFPKIGTTLFWGPYNKDSTI